MEQASRERSRVLNPAERLGRSLMWGRPTFPMDFPRSIEAQGTPGGTPDVLRRDRERWGMRECYAAWRFGVNVREYRELEAGDRMPDFETWDRICKLYGWPQTFADS
jgi:hypothetical protein